VEAKKVNLRDMKSGEESLLTIQEAIKKIKEKETGEIGK